MTALHRILERFLPANRKSGVYRSDKREHFRLEVFKFALCDGVDCEIQNISDVGACIMTKRPCEPGTIVEFELSPSRLVSVRWVEPAPANDGFKMGLVFLS